MSRTATPFLAALLFWLPLNFAKADEVHDGLDTPMAIASTDWPWWRGPTWDGVAASDQKPPVQWSATENVLWKTRVPGKGHGSPTVVGNFIFLATADDATETQSVLCFDRATGRELWRTEIHRGGFTKKGHRKSSLASSSVACDGRRVFINFLNRGAIYTTALDIKGRQLWQTKVTDYVVHQGYGSSPAVVGPLVIVSADNSSGGVIAGLDRASGDVVWKQRRPKLPNYTSPILLDAAGRKQLVLTGCNLVSSFDPLTGKKLWEVKGATEECVTSTVTDGRLVFTTGGFPKKHMSAIRADGSGEVVWENSTQVYVPSLLFHDGYLYGVTDGGVATCWKSATGKVVWKGRLAGRFTSSPILVGRHIYVTSETGKTYIFQADPKAFHRVAENQLGNEVFPTPTICGGRIYMRVAIQEEDQRQEMLYCLGTADASPVE